MRIVPAPPDLLAQIPPQLSRHPKGIRVHLPIVDLNEAPRTEGKSRRQLPIQPIGIVFADEGDVRSLARLDIGRGVGGEPEMQPAIVGKAGIGLGEAQGERPDGFDFRIFVRRQVEVGDAKAREVASTIAFDVEETLAVVAWPRAGELNGGIVDREVTMAM
jgi:hypothetical protein